MPPSSESLTEALAVMSRFFVGDATLHQTLEQVSDLACRTVTSAAMVGLTMLVDGRASTAVFTDRDAPEIDSAQYRSGVGPCLDAFRHREVYRVADMDCEPRWPEFALAASAHGIKSSMSIPLQARREAIGALNFYARVPAGFDDDDVDVGVAFAAHAAISLANAQAYCDAQQLGENLAAAMMSWAVIEQAKGILMGAQHCDADEAFRLLVRASQRENRKLRDLAELIVARTTRQADGPKPE